MRHVERSELDLSFGGIVDNAKIEVKFSFFRYCRSLVEGISEERKTYCIKKNRLGFFASPTKQFICRKRAIWCSEKHILSDSFNIQSEKNYAMFSICGFYFHIQKIYISSYVEPQNHR